MGMVLNNYYCRLSEITIHNFKNVEKGTLSFDCKNKKYHSSILGLYGQNGSGKTALIEVIDLLAILLEGQSLPVRFADQINIDSKFAYISYILDISSDIDLFKVKYELYLRKAFNESEHDDEGSNSKENKYVDLFRERLSYSFISNNNVLEKMSVLIDTDTKKVFAPVSKYEQLVGSDENTLVNLLVAKKMSELNSKSFIFSKALLDIIKKHAEKTKSPVALQQIALLSRIKTYGARELFVINTESSRLISLNTLPLFFRYKGKDFSAGGSFPLLINRPSKIPENLYAIVNSVINKMNIVLENLIPGLTVNVRCLEKRTSEEGKPEVLIELMSCRNGKEIPLCYESEGIKKIISILHLLIVVYNNPSVTVAIDEIDSGVFEYLLGELLKIISENGQGQLIFTSHNLRPLETLYKGFIAFTTTNPANRYIRMTNIGSNNNLRDVYYRNLILEGQNEKLYDYTSSPEISFAFMEAGQVDE